MNSKHIKAIPKLSEGNMFRSLLEFRWSLFFQATRINYLYESQLFDTENGWYLPDFYLPNLGAWIEIKPIMPTVSEKKKCLDISKSTNQIVILLAGKPELKRFSDGVKPSNFCILVWTKNTSNEPIRLTPSDIYDAIEKENNSEKLILHILDALIKAMGPIDHSSKLLEFIDKAERLEENKVRYDRQKITNQKKLTVLTENEKLIIKFLG